MRNVGFRRKIRTSPHHADSESAGIGLGALVKMHFLPIGGVDFEIAQTYCHNQIAPNIGMFWLYADAAPAGTGQFPIECATAAAGSYETIK